MEASKHGQLECAKCLINSNASLDPKDKNGLTALAMAKQHEHKELVEYLESVISFRSALRNVSY